MRIAVHTGEALVTFGEGPTVGRTSRRRRRQHRLAAAVVRTRGLGDRRGTDRAGDPPRDRLRAAARDTGEGQGRAAARRSWRRPCAPTPPSGRRTTRLRSSVGSESGSCCTTCSERTIGDRTPRLVTVVGEPGIGKTRLVLDLHEHLRSDHDGVGWHRGRCRPFGESITYAALDEVVRSIAGIPPGRRGRRGPGCSRRRPRRARPEHGGPGVAGNAAASAHRAARPATTRQPTSTRSSRRGRASSRRLRNAAAHDRRRGPALGGRRLARVPRAADGTRARRSAVPAVHGPAGAVRPSSRAGPRASRTRRRSRSRRSPIAEMSELLGALLLRSVMSTDESDVLLRRAGGNPLYAREFVHMLAGPGRGTDERSGPTSVGRAASGCRTRCRR